MVCSVRFLPGCCVLSALAVLVGCGSSKPEPGPLVTPDAGVDAAYLTDAAFGTGLGADAISLTDVGMAMSSITRTADPQVPVADSDTLALDNAVFAFAAYRQLIATNSNLVFSPASISIALAMAYAGAAGSTASEMAQTLHFSLPPARLHPAFNALDQALTSRGQGFLGADGGPMRLHIVNSAWAERTYTFKADFLDLLAANYGAGVNLLDFIHAPEPSRVTINNWVADQTENKIQNLLPPGSVDNTTTLVLTNAVYFNAAWASPFDANNTHDGPFTLLAGNSANATFMHADLYSTLGIQGTNFVAASLPYADERLSLVLVVPDVGQFSQVESSLDAAGLGTLVAGLTSRTVMLSLPRFKVTTQASLATLLQTLGMTSAFYSGVADFSGMDGTHNLYISDVIHKAVINVAEKGTEAAAATGVIVSKAALPVQALVVNANRPFLYFLRDQPTGAILFMGRILDPSLN